MVSLLEKNKIPAYVKIAGDLLDSIENGEYPKNSLLPSERILAREHHVSSIVINRALNLLSKRGIIEKVPRKGSYVRGKLKKTKTTSKTKIVINGASSPKDINERASEFTQILSKEFPQIDFEYIQGSAFARKNNEFPQEESDILISSERMFANFALDGRVASLDDLVDSLEMEDFYPQPFEACRVDGSLKGLPLNFNPSVLYCNMSVIEKTSLGENDLENLTWNDFINICSSLKKSDATTFPLGFFEYTSCWWENFFYTHGLDIIKKEHFETDIFTPAGLNAIEVMRRLTQNGISENLTIRRDALSLLSENKVGFVICNPRLLMELTNNDKWFFTQIPMSEKSVSAANAFVLSINADSDKKALCKEILHFMMSDKFQNWLGTEQAIAPVRRSALRKSYDSPYRQALISASETSRMLPNQIPYWEVHDEMGKAIHRLLSGAENIDEMETEINEKLYLAHQESGSMRLLGIA